MGGLLTKDQAARVIQIMLWTRNDFVDTEMEALKMAIEELSKGSLDELDLE